MRPRRVFLLVMDSVGCGGAPDAARFGDEGTDTLGHIAQHLGGLHLPNLASLGLGNAHHVEGVPPVDPARGAWGCMREASVGKDTTTGHWELAGLVSERPFAHYPDGFPDEIMARWTKEAGVAGYLGNRPASGTRIIQELGAEHMATGLPIVYTSADSVFQIAAHEEVVPLERLYDMCRAARRVLDDYGVARVIARPFVGTPEEGFTRTYDRHDFSLAPTGETVLDQLFAAGLEVIGVGKIEDIFAGRGITRSIRTHGNAHGMEVTTDLARGWEGTGLVFINLIDFDSLYGHRRNPEGYGRALEEFDAALGGLLDALGRGDLLMITADHGCDPTFEATTDHTRERVPILAHGPGLGVGPLGERGTYADVASTIADIFGVPGTGVGTSFWRILEGRA